MHPLSKVRTIKVLRTPDDRFIGLPSFGFKPHYAEVRGTRVHYVDEGSGETVLLLHGEPTWGFMFRKVVHELRKHHRVVALDFVGFGRSDKFPKVKDYSFHMHLRTLERFIEHLDLKDITLVVHDWGGLIGLSALGRQPNLFKRVVILNTALPTGETQPSVVFRLWRWFVRWSPWIKASTVVAWGCRKSPDQAVRSAYDAPYPSREYLAGVRAWPLLMPTKPTDAGVAEMQKAHEVLKNWRKPAFVLFSDGDPIFPGAGKNFRELIPTAKDQPETIIRKAGHFLLEDRGEEVAQHISAFIQRS